jgi:transposase-like protein
VDRDISLPFASGKRQREIHERSSERIAYRNGYRTRAWDTRVGTIELKIPKVSAGSYFPSLLEPRRRAEKALHAVVVEAYVKGISTRKVDDLVRARCRSVPQKSRNRSFRTHVASRRLAIVGSRFVPNRPPPARQRPDGVG